MCVLFFEAVDKPIDNAEPNTNTSYWVTRNSAWIKCGSNSCNVTSLSLEAEPLDWKLWCGNIVLVFYEKFVNLGPWFDLMAVMSRNATVEYVLTYILLYFDLEDKIIFRGVGNDMINVCDTFLLEVYSRQPGWSSVLVLLEDISDCAIDFGVWPKSDNIRDHIAALNSKQSFMVECIGIDMLICNHIKHAPLLMKRVLGNLKDLLILLLGDCNALHITIKILLMQFTHLMLDIVLAMHWLLLKLTAMRPI